MQLKALHLPALTLVCAVLFTAALTAYWSAATAVAQQAGTSGLSVSVDWADTGRYGHPNVRFSVTNADGPAKEYVEISCAFLLNGRVQTTVDWFVGDIGAGETAYETAWSEDKNAGLIPYGAASRAGETQRTPQSRRTARPSMCSYSAPSSTS